MSIVSHIDFPGEGISSQDGEGGQKRNRIVEQDLVQITSADLPWSEFEGATVLVTGANGLIGAYLAEALLYLNESRLNRPLKLLALVRNRDRALARFSAYRDRPDLEFIVQDICRPLEIEGSVHYIVHAASQASPKYYIVDPAGTIASNVIGTYNLLEFAKQSKTRSLLFVSSGEVYGQFQIPPATPLKEDQYGSLDPLALRSCYGEGKRAGEAMCAAWHLQFGVHAAIARLGHTYGPGMDLQDGRVFADFVGNVVRGENIRLKSDGFASRPFCYLSDATVGLLTVLLKGRAGAAYHIVNDEMEIRIVDLAHLICGLFPEKHLRVTAAPSQREHVSPSLESNPGIRVDTTKARALGWCPSVTLETGFRRTIQSFARGPA